MLPHEIDVLLHTYHARALVTGSRTICKTVSEDSDYDYVVSASTMAGTRKLHENLLALGYKCDTSPEYYRDADNYDIVSLVAGTSADPVFTVEDSYAIHDSTFRSYKKDKINIILVFDSSAFYKWATATALAKSLGLEDKHARVYLFSYILGLGGETYHSYVPPGYELTDLPLTKEMESSLPASKYGPPGGRVMAILTGEEADELRKARVEGTFSKRYGKIVSLDEIAACPEWAAVVAVAENGAMNE